MATMFLVECLYIRHVGSDLLDIPNERSSHQKPTVRGGGVIFPLAGLLFFVCHSFVYAWFFLGLVIISVLSFLDDKRPLSRVKRISFQLLATFVLFWQAGVMEHHWGVIICALVVATGIINAYNFMDGINGITGLYSLVVVFGLWALNQSHDFIHNDYLYLIALANGVFLWFNFRPKGKAICFAGDVGSVSMAFLIIFPLVLLINRTQNIQYILLLAVYGVDSVITILYRIRKRENIFVAHRTHFYQYLANEAGWSHQSVSLLYAALQLGFIALLYYGTFLTVAIGFLLYIVAYLGFRQYVIRKFAATS